MNLNLVRDFFICVPATAFFAILFKVPRKAVPVSTVLGSVGYVVYEWTSPVLGSSIAGYFIATFLMAVCSEISARIIKMPTTVFIIPAIIPLVPGIGLYNTMMYLVQGQDAKAGQTGIATILAIIAMAMALVFTSIFTSGISTVVKAAKKRT
jgi:uncharacterized membrane protein YjjB (DUF3815 family)